MNYIYNFLLNMWIMGRINEEYLLSQQQKGNISDSERKNILTYKQQ